MVPVRDVHTGMTHRIFNFSALHEPQPFLGLVSLKGGNIFKKKNRKDDHNMCLVIFLNANIQDNLGKCDDSKARSKVILGQKNLS